MIAINCNKTLNCINLFEYFLLVSPPLNKVPIPRIKTTSRVHITAGGIRHDLLEQAHTLSEDQLQNIEGSFRLSEEIAHQGIATATPTFSQRLQSFGYSLMSPDTTPNRNLFDRGEHAGNIFSSYEERRHGSHWQYSIGP